MGQEARIDVGNIGGAVNKSLIPLSTYLPTYLATLVS
jgi:hypothetical protein